MHAFSNPFDHARMTIAVAVGIAVVLIVAAAHRAALNERLGLCIDGARVAGVATVQMVETAAASEPYHRVVATLPVAAATCASGRKQLRLTWPAALGLPQVGERWLLQAKLRAPWSLFNPGGFDYERWLLSKGIDGSGFVSRAERSAEAERVMMHRWRTEVETGLAAATLQPGVMKALAVADSSGISDAQWSLFRRSGTVHLLVVSGLHVGVVSGLAAGLAAWVLRGVFGVFLAVRLPVLSGLVGVAAATAYVALSGEAVPVLRALIMLAAACAVLTSSRRVGVSTAFFVALSIVLVGLPLALLSSGLWLSFGAVGVLIWHFANHYAAPVRLRGLRLFVRAQCALYLGMLPLLAALVGEWSVAAPLANVVAVPLVSFGVVPPLLLSVLLRPLSDGLAYWLLLAADFAADVCVEWLESVPWPVIVMPQPTMINGLLSAVAGVVMLLPIGVAKRALLLPAVLLLFIPTAEPLPDGEVRVGVLDVGQGSAAVVETRHHALLFDAGARYPTGFNLGEQAVVPALAQLTTGGLDVVVVSHPDIDHSGGARMVQMHYPLARRIESSGAGSCHETSPWTWDGVQFSFISSAAIARAADDNDRSCTLLATNGAQRVLITGDTSSRYEVDLSRSAGGPVDFLVAPHHGSRTSSSKAFVRLLRPQWVVFSAGRGNRYGHPSPDVVARYLEIGATPLVTFRHGMLSWRSDRPDAVSRWRRDDRRYWTQASSM